MKKIFLMLICLMLLTGCGKVDKDKLINDFVDKVESSKAYYAESKMEIYNAEDTFTYNMKVYYMDDDYFKVNMLNTLNNHEQVILKDDEAVYVVTPSLNKSYKFQSEWPYNSSQSYILNTLVKDLKDNGDIEFKEEEDGYSLKVGVNYPNNSNLKYQKLFFDKNKNLEMVCVYDENDVMAIKVVFNSIDYKANLNKKDFDIQSLVDDNCCTEDNNKKEENKDDKKEDNSENKVEDNEETKEDNKKEQATSSLEDIIYPLYVPANTFLKGKELISTENGDRAILTFNGEKNFVLIEEETVVNDEFEIVPVYGDPLMLCNAIGAISSNSLSWTANNINYYLASEDLSTEELLTIADSLTMTVALEK